MDIVYILKNGIQSEELKYSLRSVERNFPHDKVWFYGGRPDGLEPDFMVDLDQVGRTRFERVNNTLRAVFENNKISEDFWLFNDDFFILRKVKDCPYWVNGSIPWYSRQIKARHNGSPSAYTSQLDETVLELRIKKCDRLNYAVHVPMRINRQMGLETLETFRSPMFRNLYGNHHKVGGVIRPDVKIFSLHGVPDRDWEFLSTSDQSFKSGEVGKFIRNKFRSKSRFEV